MNTDKQSIVFMGVYLRSSAARIFRRFAGYVDTRIVGGRGWRKGRLAGESAYPTLLYRGEEFAGGDGGAFFGGEGEDSAGAI
jgi:hypothetical protein